MSEFPPSIRVTKLDAARRQLKTAIELWFADGDPISIHALSYAAHEILHRLYRQRGLTDLLFDSTAVKDEFRDELNIFLKQDANFIKHANRETQEIDSTEFKPEHNTLFLTTCVTALQRMNEQLEGVESAFMFWHYLHHPTWFPEEVAKEQIPVQRLDKMRGLSKREFLAGFRDALAMKQARGYDIEGKKK